MPDLQKQKLILTILTLVTLTIGIKSAIHTQRTIELEEVDHSVLHERANKMLEVEIVEPIAILEPTPIVEKVTEKPMGRSGQRRPTYIGEFEATAYCPCEKCCGEWVLNRPNGQVITASGEIAKEGLTIAADWNVLPKGSTVEIEGLGSRTVHDKGGAIKGNRIDVYFESHQEAIEFGRKVVKVWVKSKDVSPVDKPFPKGDKYVPLVK